MTVAVSHPLRPVSGRASQAAVGVSRGWRRYLVVAALLAPLCVPNGPGQSSMLDLVNLPALAMFGLFLLSGHRIRTPLFFSVLVISVGSALGTFGAPSMGKAALAVAQDAYLFAWFVMLVNIMPSERDIRAVRVAWMAAGVAVALVALVQVILDAGSLSGLLAARGIRPAATLYNSNMLADYLVLCLFVTMSLWRDVSRWVVFLAALALCVGLVATKSNGGLISLGAGLGAWFMARAFTSRMSWRPLFAMLAIAACLGGIAWWLNAEFKVGDAQLESIRRHTFASRMEKSAQDRGRIRETLERTYASSPLGVGPGNSSALTVSIAERERRDSYQAKEAHSDYLAYAIERGPLGLLGLLVMTLTGFAHVFGYWRSSPHRGVRARRAARWTACMAGALTASAVHSAVIEKLHFRHFWLFLAMVCASTYAAQRRAMRRSELAPEPPAPKVASVGLAPRIPGRRVPAFVGAGGEARALTPRRKPSLPRALRAIPALARHYRGNRTASEVLS